jgi:hypothetical protein
MTSPADYLWQQMLGHVSVFFTEQVRAHLDTGKVAFLPYGEAVRREGPVVVIPTDIPAPLEPDKPYTAPFNGTHLTLWNPIPMPPGAGWRPFPGEAAPLWYQHQKGTTIPAWNLFGNLFDLLTFREERELSVRDKHRRFLAAHSPRPKAGLLEVPAFNEAAAVLVAACAGLDRNGIPDMHLDKLLKPPVVVLSHDCDILLGNDLWTQLVRGVRVAMPIAHGKLPRIDNLWWMLRNALSPKRFYFDNVTGMIDIERCFGYLSTVYLLNGTGGRYGARSPLRALRELVQMVPNGWDVGMHYNYDTYLDGKAFRAQRDELTGVVGRQISAGRAHYLRFDSEKSPPFLQSFGIRCDESSGYPDSIGYRNGIGGSFQAYDVSAGVALDIYEVPMVVMDAVLVNQYGYDAVAAFRRLLSHLSRIGGALSLVFHPGQFHNPEHKRMVGVYQRLLMECREFGARSMTALALADAASSPSGQTHATP